MERQQQMDHTLAEFCSLPRVRSSLSIESIPGSQGAGPPCVYFTSPFLPFMTHFSAGPREQAELEAFRHTTTRLINMSPNGISGDSTGVLKKEGAESGNELDSQPNLPEAGAEERKSEPAKGDNDWAKDIDLSHWDTPRATADTAADDDSLGSNKRAIPLLTPKSAANTPSPPPAWPAASVEIDGVKVMVQQRSQRVKWKVKAVEPFAVRCSLVYQAICMSKSIQKLASDGKFRPLETSLEIYNPEAIKWRPNLKYFSYYLPLGKFLDQEYLKPLESSEAKGKNDKLKTSVSFYHGR